MILASGWSRSVHILNFPGMVEAHDFGEKGDNQEGGLFNIIG